MVSSDWLLSTRHHFETVLTRLLRGDESQSKGAANRLNEAMQYAMLNGGKRARPLLCYAAGADFGVTLNALDQAAAAIEAVHVYSLVHDDLPCMDDDVLRRGQPTCHVAYDEPTALLVGDALQSVAFEWLIVSEGDAAGRLRQVGVLASAIGAAGMAGGQQLDLMATNQSGITLEGLENIHRMKTGALIEASIIIGALAVSEGLSSEDESALRQFGRALGLAFQVIDDVLDATVDTAALGKTAGKDAEQNKATYVRFLGVEEARHYAHRLNEEATTALAQCSVPTPHLAALQAWLIARTF